MAAVAVLLCSLELYHLIAHVLVLFGVRMLPRKDLVRLRYYFLMDTLTVFSTNFLYLQQLQWLAALQMIQHLWYVFTWNESKSCRKVISWSSLDWTGGRWILENCWDVVTGTAFDTGVHAINFYLLSHYLTATQLLVATLLNAAMFSAIIFNPRFAWSRPGDVPAWVRKRIGSVGEERDYFKLSTAAIVGLFGPNR